MCVCVFWPPGELEKAGGKAAIGRWQRCYQPDERLPRPSFDKQVTEKGCGPLCKQTLSSKLNFSQKLNFPSPSTAGKDNPQEAPSQFARHGWNLRCLNWFNCWSPWTCVFYQCLLWIGMQERKWFLNDQTGSGPKVLISRGAPHVMELLIMGWNWDRDEEDQDDALGLFPWVRQGGYTGRNSFMSINDPGYRNAEKK